MQIEEVTAMTTHEKTPRSVRIGAAVAAALLSGAAASAEPGASDDAITIYSMLQPGAVSPELYRVNDRNYKKSRED